MESFIFAVNAVMPIILTVVIGYIIKRAGILNEDTTKVMNKLVFRILLPSMLFLNIYKIESFASIDLGYIAYGITAVVVIFLISIPLIMMITKENSQRGVLIQATFRSNFALIGIPLASSLFGDEGAMVATLLSAFAIPTLNILAVISLTVFGTGKPTLKKTLLGIVKNPLIQGVCAGCIALIVRALFAELGISFKLSDIKPIYTTLEYLGRCATPIALLVLGAQFEFSAIPALKHQIIWGTAIRTFIVPAVALVIAYFIGKFNGAHFAAFVALFGTPVAVSSVPMSQEMGGDSSLAGQMVVWTTIFSAFSLFIVSFVLKEIGIFI